MPTMAASEGTTVQKERRPGVAGRDGELPCLEVLIGSEVGRIYPLRSGENFMGRHAKLQVAIDDEGISRKHAKIVVAGEGLVNLVDLQSTNGTFLNGVQVDVAVLREGDRVALGPDVFLRFTYHPYLGEAAPQKLDLSEREMQVAVLVGEGMTNAEIGEQLGISPHTVMTHLSKIYKRLELRSRAELAKVVVSSRAPSRPSSR
jgi:DNA-binding CsgD family transcriptional regulator